MESNLSGGLLKEQAFNIAASVMQFFDATPCSEQGCQVADFSAKLAYFADFKSLWPKKKFLLAKTKKAENRPILGGLADKMPIF